MATGKRIGYARVSTDEQHLDLQLAALEAYGCERVYSDHGISGGRFDRPGLRAALAAARTGSTLVVWRLDRLGRSLRDLAVLMGDLGQRGVRIVSLTEYIDTGSTSGRFTFHMLAAMAEFERGLISERTRAGMAAARARGSRIGRQPALDDAQCRFARQLLLRHSLTAVARMLEVDRRTLQRALSRAQSRERGEAPAPQA
ncbi:recombinase family protein [Paraburkholderia kururiensis]|uniref:recombinase family protein n=1 Tax=Paraburkholderia kururiensis TaxID=984307 RepID=UPI000F8759A3|nr:recombinase family protein [Paraburkholderia kururiensis]